MGFRDRKKERKEYYEKYIGKKLVRCTACSGSGYYDMCDKKSRPIKCSCCEGTGKMREGNE